MKTECYLAAAAETDELSLPPDLVRDPALNLGVIVEDLEIIGVQHLAETAGKPTEVGWKPQQVALLNFLLELRLVELHPGEVFDDVLNVVAELVGGDGDQEQPFRTFGVLREVRVLRLSVRWEICGADRTLAQPRQTSCSLRLELGGGLNGVVGWQDGLGPPASFLARN